MSGYACAVRPAALPAASVCRFLASTSGAVRVPQRERSTRGLGVMPTEANASNTTGLAWS